MKHLLLIGAAFAVLSTPASASSCRDARGKFIKCPPAAAVPAKRCKDAKGKFAKCGTSGVHSA